MSDVNENEDDFGTRRRQAIFGDDEDTEDDDNDGETEDKQYTEEELEKERKDLLSRGYTPESVEEFIAALRDGENYQAAAESYLKLTPDESEDEDETVSEKSGERDLLSEEYPLMKKQMEAQERGSGDEEFPLMAKELNKKKKIVSPKDWKPIDDYPSMEEEFGKE